MTVLNSRSGHGNPPGEFFLVGQDAPGPDDQKVFARVVLMYSNDPLFKYVPVGSIAQVPVTNKHLHSVLPDKTTVMDDTGYRPKLSLPELVIEATETKAAADAVKRGEMLRRAYEGAARARRGTLILVISGAAAWRGREGV